MPTVLVVPALVAFFGSAALAQPSKPLRAVANFPVGVAVNAKALQAKGRYATVVKTEFSSITAENMMKMKFLQPAENEFTFGKADSLLAFAEAAGIRVHGHALVWHEAVPEWVLKYDGDKAKIEAILKRHVQMVASHFRTRVSSWDVVNEAISDTNGQMRKTIWYRNIGPDYIEKAFRWAKEMDGKALLFYNEYGMDDKPVKLTAVVNLLKDLQKKKVPIDGIGIQMHTWTGADQTQTQKALRELGNTGLQVHISELDVCVNGPVDKDGGMLKDNKLPADLAKKQEGFYTFVANAYKTYVPRKQQYGITMWNLSDDDSWVPKYFKKPDFPCIFDAKLGKKPAYFGLWNGMQ